MSGPPPPPPPKNTGPPPPPLAAPKPQTRGTGGSSLSDLLSKKRIEPSNVSEAVSSGVGGFTYFQEKSKTGYVGLSNQGATCYLNSLIQTLYMTPEFKGALFNWNYSPENDGPEASCIPLQLQGLFGLLQEGQAAVQETKNLTLSFGWSATDAFRQHDVQELLRKLFEAMEIIFKHGNLKDASVPPVHQLYEGTLKDYIKCLENGHERVRFDPFMDLLLSIRDIDSLQAALDLYTEEEILDEGNKWSCEACGTRVKAAKGLRLKSAPLFLTLQLKRFDYDYTTWQRIKLNNRVTFPMDLDIKKWLTEESDTSNTVYELFSVLIHQGGAQGGHYYAMIKDIRTQKWFKFNDASVMEIEAKEIESMYGEKPGDEVDEKGQNKIIRNKIFSTNAYLLWYRRKGDPVPQERPLPEYIKKMIEEENQKFTKAKEEYIQRRDNLPLDLHFKESVLKLHIDKNKTLKEAVQQAYTLAGMTGSLYTLDCIRLRKYNPETGTLGRVWKSEELEKSLDQLGLIKSSILKLETREPGDQFLADAGEYKLQVVKAVDGKLEEPLTVVVPSRETTLLEFKKILESLFQWPCDEIVVVKVSPDASTKILTQEDNPKELQKDFGYTDGNSIHVERIHPTNAADGGTSIIALIFEEARSCIQINFNKLDERTYDNEITISKKKSLAYLRQQLAVLIDCKSDEFQICKTGLGNQFKDESLSLEEHGIYDGQSVHLKKGEPLQANQVRLTFSFYDHENDLFKNLKNQHKISQDTPVEDIRKIALQEPELEEMKLTDISYLRLRAQTGKKVGPILFDGNSLKKSIPTLLDLLTISIQVLDKPEFVKPNQILLLVRRWYPSKQELQEKGEEMVLPERCNILTLKKHIASHQQEIAEEHLALAKPFSYQLKNKSSLSALLKWDLDPETPLHDGDLVLYKDIRDPEVEIEGLTPQTGLNQGIQRPKEVGIKIHTVYDEEGRAKFEQLLGEKNTNPVEVKEGQPEEKLQTNL